MNLKCCFMLIYLLVFNTGCTEETNIGKKNEQEGVASLDIQLIENTLGMQGTESNGEYKVAVPQHDLTVSVDSFRIIPPMGTTSWAAFTPMVNGTMVMGDIVLLEDEIGPMQKTVIEKGLRVSALHNHFARDEPKLMFMHIHGMGETETLAKAVRTIFDRVKELRTAKGLQGTSVSVQSSFDPEIIEDIIGHSGSMNAGIYKITLGRPDVELVDHGLKVSTFMGFNTWMAFQGTAEKAAVAGDFAMLEHEVAPVIAALVQNDIEVVAVHNHMVNESPRIFFLHYWGVGSVEKLARGLKAGLDQTGK